MNQNSIEKKLQESLDFIKQHSQLTPAVAIILGSGLGDFADKLENKTKIPTNKIPHYPRSTVAGHKGFLVFGNLSNIPVMAVQGRTHFYEGYDIRDVAYVVRIMARLGVKALIVTNAAGGVNRKFRPGDLMIIRDHINFMFRPPLSGGVVEGETRWPDMSDAYDAELSKIIEETGLDLKIPLWHGVLFVSTGPTYETAAEVRMARYFGADAVSMSTVPEVLVARTNKIKVAGISCITNYATGIGSEALSHDEVTEIANLVKDKFQKLIKEVIIRVGKQITGSTDK